MNKMKHIYEKGILKIDSKYRKAFLSAFIIGFLVHCFKFTNYLPNHNSVFNTYNEQNVLASGRWLLSFACRFSSYFDLPWINGVLTLLFLSVSSLIIIKLFEIERTSTIVLCSGLLVAFPSVTEILFYEFTADGFMIAMLLSILSVYVLFEIKNIILRTCLSSLLLCCSCGIYQAYVSFSIVLFICVLFLKIFSFEFENKKTVKYIINEIVVVSIALVSYYVIWRICMSIQNVVPTQYEGIGDVGKIGASSILNAIKNSIIYFFGFFVDWDGHSPHINPFSLLNIVFILLFIVILIFAIIKTTTYKSVFKIIVIVLSLFAIPFIVCMWYFSSPGVEYKVRMVNSIVVFYVFALVLFERYTSIKKQACFSVVVFCIVFNFAINANIAYYYMNFEYEHSYADAVEMEMRIDELIDYDKGIDKVAIIGDRSEDTRLRLGENAGNAHTLYLFEDTLFYDGLHSEYFLKSIMNAKYNYVSDLDSMKVIKDTPDYNNMGKWPAKNSVKVVENTIVVRLN